MNKIFFIATIVSAVFLLAYVTGPLPENTGAPGEMTCYRSSCHVNNGQGKGSVYLRLQDTSNTYINGDTLELDFGFNQTFSTEHGFQIVALDSNNQNIGQWLIAGSPDYQQISGIGFPNRKYLEHTMIGTANNSWQVDWATPASYQGDIKFYASFLSTNDDDDNSGDTLYNEQLVLNYNNNVNLAEVSRAGYPFAATTTENSLVFENFSAQPLEVQLISLNGQILNSFKCSGKSRETTSINKDGVYILRVKNQAEIQTYIRKLMAY